ncbi:hypothetical protein [Microbacterium sp. YJN-G]|uniref:hypothetical protein n=1 Tax=Microbacterium sp. YJN-G TaxID=2763257 RepID=UPI0018779E19|nr:hypothetical protein [Microbacterium sp. YJN-G]
MTTTGDPHGPAPQGVSAFLAVVIGFAAFASLAILGLGMLTFYADLDILTVEGLDSWPAIVGMIAAIGVFSWMLWTVLSRRHPPFPAVIPVGLATVLAHLAVVWLAALLSGAGLAAASAAVSQLVVRGSSLIVLLAALIGAWIAIALRRTRARALRWPWEDRDEE